MDNKQSNNQTNHKNTPISAHPDPAVPNVEGKVAQETKEKGQEKYVEKHENHMQPTSSHTSTPSAHTPLKADEALKEKDPSKEAVDSMKGEVVYEDKVIQKIIGAALEQVDGLLTADGGFFSNMKEKLVNTDDVTTGIHTEVGKKEVAVDMKIVVEYGKDIDAIYQQIKKIIAKEVAAMTHLKVIEVNVDVVDIQSKEEFEANSETVQDKVTKAAKTTGQFASEQTEKAKSAISEGTEKIKNASEK
ncbi:Asp23/Gls24 family envelope stress response protein [Enterococcus ratti]|uniref:Stress response regulator gls24 homolog n=1 Tax=Enterococcus ratti TaxID=150033 RepID=A0A1L8WPE0_9ENTE|nr:Asp23/Gls24 family envelope stress response protein [Enterococcus ratti]OJG82888.1 general stress protein [Enterococcus ratti]